MKYLTLLRTNSYPEKGKGMAMQRKISEYKGWERDIQAAEAEMEKTTSDRKKEKLAADIATGKAKLVEIDDQICELIDRYKTNEPKYTEAANKMRDARTKKTTSKKDPVPDPPTPPVDPPKPEPTKTDPVPDPPPPPKKQEKKSSAGTWLFAGVAIIGLFVGINLWQSRK